MMAAKNWSTSNLLFYLFMFWFVFVYCFLEKNDGIVSGYCATRLNGGRTCGK